MSIADKMPEIRELVFGTICDRAVVAGFEIKGKFYKRYREVVLPNGSIAGLDLSFDCQVSETILELEEDDEVEVQGTAYKFRRHLPEGGDESGLVTLELKR